MTKYDEMIEEFMEKRQPIVEQCAGCEGVEKVFCKSYINPAMWWRNGNWCPACSTLVPARVSIGVDVGRRYSKKSFEIKWMPKSEAEIRGIEVSKVNPLKASRRQYKGR